MVVEIPLTQGFVTLVDDEDAAKVLAAGPWRVMKQGRGANVRLYACAHGRNPLTGKGKGTVRMHRLILDAPADVDTDHRNHDGLDNRRENLRLCTRSENMANQRKRSDGTSKHKGVCWHKDCHKWQAQIGVNRHVINLGYFDSEAEAARAYDAAAHKHFGEFACLNFSTEEAL